MAPEQPYNPLDKRRLGESVAKALLERGVVPLRPIAPFDGAGIYTIYYHGDFKGYADVADQKKPIYVGKADPPGARRGRVGLDEPAGQVLYRRLQEHADSIRQVNLRLEDFGCRYLVVDDIWIPLAESVLIRMYQPLWNQVIAGFGNHDPGSGRKDQERSAWDTIHPGRPWAFKLPPNSNADALIVKWGGGQTPAIAEETPLAAEDRVS